MATAILMLGSLLSLLSVASASAASASAAAVLRLPSEAVVAPAQREFDYYSLALQWPATYCQRTRYCCPKNGCCRSRALTGFTIHGLWPDYNDGRWPSCCSGPDFDEKKISSLIPELEKYWPSLSCSSSALCHGGKGLFWAHEWEKHGTCSSSVTGDEYSYFSTVLNLYAKYNITAILNNAGFLATNAEQYLLGDIVAAIEKSVGASPLLVCKHGSVEELRLCLSKDLKPRDCTIGSNIKNDTSTLRSSCPKYISLPTYTPIVAEGVSAAHTLGNGKPSRPLRQIMKSLWG